MTEERKMPTMFAKAPDGIGGPEYVKKIQENIEAGKRNAPDILRQIALFNSIQENVKNAK